MATVDLLLSSPPPHQLSACQVAAMSSSPVFPSPNALVCRRPQLKPGSRAAPIPAFATTSFTTAADLLRERKSPTAATATDDPFTDKPSRAKSSRKPRTFEKVVDGDEPSVKKPRKPRAKKVAAGAEAPVVLSDKPPRKPRVKKDATEDQAKIPKGRVTKASTGSRAEKAGTKKKTGIVSSHFTSAATNPTDPFDNSTISKNSLLLQEAVKRRQSWTPPRSATELLEPTSEKDGESSSLSSLSGNKQQNITSLFGKFSHGNGDDNSVPERVPDQPGTKKRKLIELITTNQTAAAPVPTKPKALKKKPRTLTELATSAYAVDTTEIDSDSQHGPLLRHFSYLGTTSTEEVVGTVDGFKIPPKPRAKSPVKTSSKASKSKKGTAQAPILLSPQTALKRVEKQEFVFGTSSQLAREDSPSLLRDIQQAMRASNQVEDDPFTKIAGDLSPPRSVSTSERGTDNFKANRNLWAAASRGVDGESASIETVDMSKSPLALASLRAPVPLPDERGAVTKSTSPPVEDEWHSLEADDFPVNGKSHNNETAPAEVGPVEAAIRSELLSSPLRGNETVKVASSMTHSIASKPPANSDVLSDQLSGPKRPDYGSYPTTKLAKEIASYRFKPVKGRDQMISLLEKCWEGKQKVAASNVEKLRQDRKSSSDTNKPLVLRQSPKRQKKKASPIPEKIYDSDSPTTPSPPRRRIKMRTPPLSLRRSVDDDNDESVGLSPTSQQLLLHKHITRAITTAPPSKDSKNPSWHEKILLYDPIILEDLAVWLNTGALQKVGWDGEVDPKELKIWCLKKSICCLWRENLRGMSRSRY